VHSVTDRWTNRQTSDGVVPVADHLSAV